MPSGLVASAKKSNSPVRTFFQSFFVIHASCVLRFGRRQQSSLTWYTGSVKIISYSSEVMPIVFFTLAKNRSIKMVRFSANVQK